MFKIGRVLAAAAIVGLLAASNTADAARAPAQPLGIRTSTVLQDGQQLVWRLTLDQSFSPTALSRDHRSLCLQLVQSGGGRRICVGARRGQPRLFLRTLTAAGPGPARELAATVTRGSASELTASFLPADAGLAYRPLRWQALSLIDPPACAPTASCAAVLPAAPARLALHAPKLIGCVPSGPDWVFHGASRPREVALTFDDGPYGTPPSIDFVNLLAREHAYGTFFEIGRQIAGFDPRGTVERKMLADGDMIGDHTWSHPVMTQLSASAQRSQLVSTAAAIRTATGGFTPCLFRAPYGAVDSGLLRVARSVGMATIQWNVDPRDWALPGVNAIVANVTANAHAGAIVIQHFGGGPRYQTLAALPAEISALRRRGYTFVTVTQLLGYKLIYK